MVSWTTPSYVLLTQDLFQQETIVGRIAELLTEHDTGGFGIAVIDVFAVAATRHDMFGMPYLVRRQANPSFVIVDTKVFFIAINTLCVKLTFFAPGHRV